MKKLNTIFVLGYPRSGTTWFANLFNSHPDVAYRHEVIGRCYRYFPDQLFSSLKYNNGLTDEEYERALVVVLSPTVDSDRAPFFPKNYLSNNNIKVRYFCWLAAKAVGLLEPLYKKLYYPKTRSVCLTIKETRSTVNMDSMLIGLRADCVVALFRHPCGAIASQLKGIDTGNMENTGSEERSCWFKENIEKSYLSSLNISEEEILEYPEHKYLAIAWAQQNEDYISFDSPSYDRFFVSYEAVMADKESKIKALFKNLSLSYDATVENFLTSAGGGGNKPALKDSSNTYYSVYRDDNFNPDKWREGLSEEQITDIEALTLGTYRKLVAKSEADGTTATADSVVSSIDLGSATDGQISDKKSVSVDPKQQPELT